MNPILIHSHSWSEFNTTYSTTVNIFFFEELNIVAEYVKHSLGFSRYTLYGGTEENRKKADEYLNDIGR